MPSSEQQIANLDAAIAAQEGLRATLGDAIVDATMAALRAQRDALLAQQAGPQPPTLVPASDDPFASYLPGELADKLRGAGMVQGERKQATVIFADLSGFTALSERLDPEDVRALQNDLFPEMAAAVYHYEGYVDKFIGDAIMAVFGAPIAHEDDPERALRAALDMRARIAQLNRAWQPRFGKALSLHVGINTGTVIAGDISAGRRFSYTVTGDAVNVASRLSDAAAPGQILVSRETYRLAQGAFEFAPLDPLTVKGKRDPLAVFEVQRARLYPLKLRGLKELGSAFVARERESALLREVLADLLAGRGRVVTITGEAGLGKSRLLAEWRDEIGSRARWREGRAFSHTAGMAYGPFLDFFRRYANIHDDDSEQEARAVLAEVVRRFFGDNLEAHALLANLLAMQLSPAESALLAGMPAQAIRTRIFETIAHMVEEPTRERPTVLVLEDMHWSDSTSLDLAASLLELTRRVPLALVVVCRPDPEAPSQRLLETIQSGYADCLARIALAPLSNDSTVQMLEQLLASHHLPAALTSMICARAEGNPFYVEEVIRMLIERGVLMRASDDGGEAHWQTTELLQSIQVPDTLEGVLMSRLDRLPVEAKWLAQQAAVIGRNFLYRVLVRIGDGAAGVDAELSYLERQELIREQSRDPEIEYIFKHALTQDVAYHSLLASRRKELHQRTGHALEELFAERLGEFSALIAFHYLRGEAWEKALDYLIQAGDAAMGLYSHAEARQHFAEALDALARLPDGEANRRSRVDTTVKLVSVSFAAEDPGRNLTRLAAVEPVAQALASSGVASDRLRLARVHFWMGTCHRYRAEQREAIGYYQRVLSVAQEFGDEVLLGGAASTLGRALVAQGLFPPALALLNQSIVPLEKTGNWQDWVFSMAYRSLALVAMGEYKLGVAECKRAMAKAQEIKYGTGYGVCHVLLSLMYLIGNDMPEMLQTARQLTAIAEKAGDRMYIWAATAFQGWAQSRLGNLQGAVELLAQAEGLKKTLGGRLVMEDWLAAADAEVALRAHDPAVLALAEGAVARGKALDNTVSQGLAHRTWGQALAALDPPRWDEAEAHMAASLAVLDAGGAQLEAARTHAAWGVILQQRGHAGAAREHFEIAAAQFARSELGPELDSLRQSLLADKEQSA